MAKLKRFIDIYIPTETCNLRCDYCYIAQNREFNNNVFKTSHSYEEIRKAFSIRRLGGICLINICAGGETLLSNDVVCIVKELLEEGHYVMIVTNGTVKKAFELMSEFKIDLRKRLFIKFSFHYLELKKRKMLSVFFENVNLMRKSNVSVTVELGAYDEYLPYEDEIKKICLEEVQALPHITPLRDEAKDSFSLLTKYNLNTYKRKWKSFHSSLFDFRLKLWGIKRKEFCYAGKWSFCVNIETGDITKCFCENKIDNIYKNLNKKIKLECVGKNCKAPYCYAGHAFLSIGTIPEVDMGNFASLRDRKKAKWLYEDIENIMSQKLVDNNKKFNKIEERFVDLLIKRKIKKNLPSINDFTKDVIKKIKSNKSNYIPILEARRDIEQNYNNFKNNKKFKWIMNYEHDREKITDGELIKLEAMDKKNKNSEGTEIWIVGAMVDQKWYNANEIFDTIWLEENTMLGWRNYNQKENMPSVICGKIPEGNSIQLVLEKNKWRGHVKVTYKKLNKVYDCYSKGHNDLIFIKLN